MRRITSVLLTVLLAACGSDPSPGGPAPPNFVGNYTVSGTLNGFPSADIFEPYPSPLITRSSLLSTSEKPDRP